MRPEQIELHVEKCLALLDEAARAAEHGDHREMGRIEERLRRELEKILEGLR